VILRQRKQSPELVHHSLTVCGEKEREREREREGGILKEKLVTIHTNNLSQLYYVGEESLYACNLKMLFASIEKLHQLNTPKLPNIAAAIPVVDRTANSPPSRLERGPQRISHT